MTKSELRSWKEKGPPTWVILVSIVTGMITSYALAGFGVGKFFDLIVQATEFWPSVYVIALGGSYFLRSQKINEKLREPLEGSGGGDSPK